MSNWFNKGSGTVLKFGGRVITREPDPTYTVRFKFRSGYNPTNYANWKSGLTWTQVQGETDNVWDAVYQNSDWSNLFWDTDWSANYQNANTEVLDADLRGVTNANGVFSSNDSQGTIVSFGTIRNTSGVTNFANFFSGQGSITSVPLFDTSSATVTRGMFGGCRSLASIPLYDTHNVTDFRYMFGFLGIIGWEGIPITAIPAIDVSSAELVDEMFAGCRNVASGILSIYNTLNSLGTVTSHNNTFTYCGIDTVTGAAELAQIPSSWGGTGA